MRLRMRFQAKRSAQGLTATLVAAAVTLALSAGGAEARFRMRLGGFRTSPPSLPREPIAPARGPAVMFGTTVGLPTGASAIERRRRVYGSEPPHDGIVTRSVLNSAPPPEEKPKEAEAKPIPVVKVAEPWCRSGRVTGSGAGFCLIN